MTKNYKNWKALASAAAISAILAGCGSDGKDGEPGKPGEPGPIGINITDATGIKTQVTNASFENDALVIEFDVTDKRGVSVYGLENEEAHGGHIRVSFGRMGTVGELQEDLAEEIFKQELDREIWLSYTNKMKGDLVAGTNNFRTNRDCPEESQCLEYLGDGRYRLTAENIINVQNQPYGYDADAVNGLYLMVYAAGNQPNKAVEAYYWQPATDQQGVPSPKVVIAGETCTSCHVDQEHIRHGNYGNTADGCAFCHTDYTLYAGTGQMEGGEAVEFTYNGSIKGLVHAIHTGATHADRRAWAKFESTIAKEGANPAFFHKFNKEDGVYPQEASNCHACHVDYTTDVENLPAGVTHHALDWFADIDANSCQNCHGDYHYGDYHVGDEYYGCVGCHNTDPSYGNPDRNNRGGALRHFAGHDTDSRERAYDAAKLIEVAYSDFALNEGVLSFNVALSQGEVQVDDRYVTSNSLFVNAIDPTHPKGFLVYRPDVTRTWNTDGTITATVTDAALTAAIENGASIAVTASIKACYSNKSSELSELVELDGERTCGGVVSQNAASTQYFNLDGTEGTARQSAANMENCQACHSDDMVVRYKGDHYRNADLATCAQCHEAGDYNSLAVRVHGTFGKAHGRDDVQQLLSSADCQACHNDSYTLADARNTPLRWNRKDDTWSSPHAGVCASCHVSDSYDLGNGADSAKAHIESMGGVVAGSYDDATLASESCATCHNADYIKQKHSF
ncbi:multiheme c-type cytochrome [Ferrimonas gelatinilytica]|uniref:Decaheme c-type cytochrome OmcA n=1 Tax=Ferrimonas gelatinilytica TaxID=1255257 RepID=A0ABP9SGZ3_9GAMM